MNRQQKGLKVTPEKRLLPKAKSRGKAGLIAAMPGLAPWERGLSPQLKLLPERGGMSALL